jgi:uncharacterized repeat protein (TIGR03803 family)
MHAAALVACLLLTNVAWAGGKYKVLHHFGAGKDGSVPSGPLTLDKKGNLYGVTGAGGGVGCDGYGCGTIFELTHQANGKWGERSLHAFADSGDGADPVGNLASDVSGNLYGTLEGAGPGQTAVFELEHKSGGWNFGMLYTQAVGPGLVLDKAGNVYGDIGPGDYFGAGAMGELSPAANGWTYTQLYSFCSQSHCADGRYPVDPPIWDTRGNLYDTTFYGGIGQPECPNALGCGVVFEMTRDSDGTWTYHILHRFASFPHDGQSPAAGLAMDPSGNLYGDTSGGGAHCNGTIFKFTPSAGGHWKQTVLYDFPNCANGCFPGGTLVFDKAGNLYGAGSRGLADCGGYTCGVIFKLTHQAGGKWKYSVMHKFNGADGGFPYGVILDEKGNLYGTTQAFGKYNAGVAFEITP